METDFNIKKRRGVFPIGNANCMSDLFNRNSLIKDKYFEKSELKEREDFFHGKFDLPAIYLLRKE